MTNLKPFNLAKALAGDSVITRDGRKVLQLFHFDKSSLECNLICVIEKESAFRGFHSNGRYYEREENNLDLFMVTKVKKFFLWISNKNIYENENTRHTSCAYETLEKLERSGNDLTGGQIVEIVMEIDDE